VIEQFICTIGVEGIVLMKLFWTTLPLNVNRIFQFGQMDSDQGVEIWDQSSREKHPKTPLMKNLVTTNHKEPNM